MRSLIQMIRARPRLSSSTLFGIVVAVYPFHLQLVTRLLLGWNAAVWPYLLLIGWLMARATPVQVRRIAEQEDNMGLFVLAFFSVAAVASLVAIVMELSTVKGLSNHSRLMHYALTGGTVFGTWFFVGTLFTFHYARVFYQADKDRPPLYFPDNTRNPNYWDFLYFSFTIAAASATSDVNIMSPALRKTALAQTVLSFFFNVAVLGFAINIAAGVVGN
ncbi:MAG TPA: DUF1345 domain-containing protein [Xanthomonadaceae bacterium]|jgi:uncharacterized membrane protein|nr:DUF1345 domain-containing protein [Xanthomonadaceae bacterium]